MLCSECKALGGASGSFPQHRLALLHPRLIAADVRHAAAHRVGDLGDRVESGIDRCACERFASLLDATPKVLRTRDEAESRLVEEVIHTCAQVRDERHRTADDVDRAENLEQLDVERHLKKKKKTETRNLIVLLLKVQYGNAQICAG